MALWWVNGDLLQEGLCHTQVYCTQSPCPCSRPLLTQTSSGDTQTQFCLSLCGVSGSWCTQSIFEPDILDCGVKWALGIITTNKASGGDAIPVELFQILKDNGCESAALNMSANLENSAVAIGHGNISFHSNPKERQCQRMLKLLHNCTHLTR